MIRRMYVVLGMLAHAVINGHGVNWDIKEGANVTASVLSGQTSQKLFHDTTRGNELRILPRQIAVPWRIICSRLGLPEVTDLNHSCIILLVD
jgi:hypothetical protein